MIWSRTKSIFIICFLLLDAFLIFETYQRQDMQSLQGLTGDMNQSAHVKVETVIPPTPSNVTFLRGTNKTFRDDDDLKAMNEPRPGMPRQKVSVDPNGVTLHSTFESPLQIDLNNMEKRNTLLKMVYSGQNYIHWKTNEENGKVDFVQTYDGRPVYISERSDIRMLEFTMDENGVTGFQQSYFSFNQANKVTVISAEEAVSYVEAENNVQRAKKPVISTVELSYINLVGNVEGGSLIFVPAWHIVVRDGDALSEYFVNGISREVQTLD